MNNEFTFCKKDGQIKQYYIPICVYITQAERKEHKVMVGRSDEIVEEYTCFTTRHITLNAKGRETYISKIREICSCFDVTIKVWYSMNEISVELHGDNVLSMLSSLKNLLENVENSRQEKNN